MGKLLYASAEGHAPALVLYTRTHSHGRRRGAHRRRNCQMLNVKSELKIVANKNVLHRNGFVVNGLSFWVTIENDVINDGVSALRQERNDGEWVLKIQLE